MSLRVKIVGVGLGVVTLTVAALFAAYWREAQAQIVQQYVEKARGIVLMAESTREEMGKKWQQGIFTAEQLRSWAEAGDRERVMSAIPVVTAWRAAMAKSREDGYTFKVPKFQPRNPQNEPDAIEARVLHLFEGGSLAEHFEVDADKQLLRFFRPIRLTTECLNCHGDPARAQELWGRSDGRDPTGGPMENWKAGEVHGAFEIVQSLAPAQARLNATLARGALMVGGLLTVAGLIFLFVVPYIIRRDLVRPMASIVDGLSGNSDEVTAAATQLAEGAQTLAQGTSQQAASLEEMSASVEQMSAMTKQNAEHAKRAAGAMERMHVDVAASNHALETMTRSMGAIEDSSQKIARIIKTIDDIAFQTNLLALNAAVEAARAGEAGMGFAVVADEVRALAQRAAQAAHDTTDLIEESIARAKTGASQVREVASGIAAVTDGAQAVKGLMDEVSTASQQQATGIEQVGVAIAQVQQVTERNAAGAEESAAASEELLAQAESTRGVIRNLEGLVGASADAHTQRGRGAASSESPVSEEDWTRVPKPRAGRARAA
jgi:methyl-accepting chemotaxis protein